MAKIAINGSIAIDERELSFQFIRSAGPGGQNVNQVASAVQLRFDVARSANLTDALKARVLAAAGQRATNDGVVVITANRFRTQEANRRDAVSRLIGLIRQAAKTRKRRIQTRPNRAAVERRIETKKRRAALKRTRGRTRIDQI